MYRMNKAPAGTKKWAEHVGHRTTMRVWADQRMPDLSNVWRAANETIVLYCGPTQAVLYCWWSLPATGRPRFSPLAWQQASLSIRGASKLPATAAIRQFPSSGAMAVWLALAQCASVAQHVTKWQLFGRATVDDVVGARPPRAHLLGVWVALRSHTKRALAGRPQISARGCRVVTLSVHDATYLSLLTFQNRKTMRKTHAGLSLRLRLLRPHGGARSRHRIQRRLL